VESGWEGLYGRPRPVPCAHLRGNAITPPPPGDHKGPPFPTSSALAPTDHPASYLSSRLRLMPSGRPQGCAPIMPTKQLARPVHSRGDGLSSPWRAGMWWLASSWCALDGLSYAGWIGCFSSPAATIGPAGLSLLTAAVW